MPGPEDTGAVGSPGMPAWHGPCRHPGSRCSPAVSVEKQPLLSSMWTTLPVGDAGGRRRPTGPRGASRGGWVQAAGSCWGRNALRRGPSRPLAGEGPAPHHVRPSPQGLTLQRTSGGGFADFLLLHHGCAMRPGRGPHFNAAAWRSAV